MTTILGKGLSTAIGETWTTVLILVDRCPVPRVRPSVGLTWDWLRAPSEPLAKWNVLLPRLASNTRPQTWGTSRPAKPKRTLMGVHLSACVKAEDLFTFLLIAGKGHPIRTLQFALNFVIMFVEMKLFNDRGQYLFVESAHDFRHEPAIAENVSALKTNNAGDSGMDLPAPLRLLNVIDLNERISYLDRSTS